MFRNPFRKRKIALVLGGGAARGLASIGALKVFEKHFGASIRSYDLVVGTSMGSLIGAAYCAGVPLDVIEKEALDFSWPTLLDFGLSKTGLLKGEKLEDIIEEMIGGKSFRDLITPFALTTTDIENGEEIVHTSGDLVKLVRASCSWPGIFSSVEIGGRLLSDGGIRNTIPTKAALDMGATFIIAVDPGFSVKKRKVDNALKAFVQSFQIMGEELNMYQAKAADIVIKPVLEDTDQFDFDKAGYIIQQGALAADRAIDKLKGVMRKRRLEVKEGEAHER